MLIIGVASLSIGMSVEAPKATAETCGPQGCVETTVTKHNSGLSEHKGTLMYGGGIAILVSLPILLSEDDALK